MAETNAFTAQKSLDGKVKGQVAGQAAAHGQDLYEEALAPLRQRNKVRCFTTGESYFKAVYDAMKAAKSSIFITGWQVDWDVELVEGQRLIDVLHDRITSSEDFRVYVLPWMSPKVGVNTHDLETMLAIFQLNAGRKEMQAICCPAGSQNGFEGIEAAYFAHHQKAIVIDNKVAFVGGMDLAYGRRDDDSFSLKFGGRQFGERYNPGMPALRSMVPEDGPCLSTMNLLTCTLSAGLWNAGGNTEPGMLSTILHALFDHADDATLMIVKAINTLAWQARFAPSNVALWGEEQRTTFNKVIVSAGTDLTDATVQSISDTCASLGTPNFVGELTQHKVPTRPDASRGSSVGKWEAGGRAVWNAGVDKAEALIPEFLFRASFLRVDPQPKVLPGAARALDRAGRIANNVIIDIAVASGGQAYAAREGVRQACVSMAPAVKSVTAQARAGVNEAAQAAREASTNAHRHQKAVINAFQGGMLAAINQVRMALARGLGNLADMGVNALERNTTTQDIQNLIDALKRLLKIAYVAQLTVNWTAAARHEQLLDKKVKAAPPGGAMLRDDQPRQPWQDVHLQLGEITDTGDDISPAVYDVAMNFVARWNATHASYLSDTTFEDTGRVAGKVTTSGKQSTPSIEQYLIIEAFKAAAQVLGGELSERVKIPLAQYPKAPTELRDKPAHCAVRVLRSAPRKQREQECKATPKLPRKRAASLQAQCEIQTQMVNLISGATDFVYIENQFFQSEFGTPSIDVFSKLGERLTSAPMRYLMSQRSNALIARLSTIGNPPHAREMPGNPISQALGKRIERAVRDDWPFHVYLVLPVHPEGRLDDIMVIAQIHWTMQSLVFADHSLVNRVRRAVAARKICQNPLSDSAWQAAMAEVGKPQGAEPAPYQSVGESEWGQYLTLLNLRACEMLGGKVRTEQIYVHSKLLIADDRHAIIGSANINDRSQTGTRDSELAVLVLDDAQRETAMLRDTPTQVHATVRKLRMDLWKKHLALKGPNGLVQPASEMAALIERPAAKETIEAIKKLAENNARSYHDALPFVPWSDDSDPKSTRGASLWPVCPPGTDADKAEALSARMPFHEAFWSTNGPTAKAPSGLKGHFVKLALNWTLGENNHPKEMSVMAVTMAPTSEPSIEPGRTAFG